MSTIDNEKCWKALSRKATGNLGDAHDFEVKPLHHLEDEQFPRFAHGWLKMARDSKDVYKKFIFLWMTFNSWMSLVVPDITKNDVDSYLLHCVAGCRRFRGYFDGLYNSNIQFRKWADEFASLGPVFRVIWLRNNQIGPWDSNRETRRDYVKKVNDQDPWVNKNGKLYPQFSPECAFREHLDKGTGVPADWPHIIHMIYQVRCNLFHGGKAYDSRRDQRFVELSFNILWEIFQEECYLTQEI